jgi:uncharacterized protein
MRAALPAAMKRRDTTTVTALRSALAAIENAETVSTPETPVPIIGDGEIAGAAPGLGAGDVPRRDLSETEVAGIVRREIADRHQAADLYDRAGRSDHARQLRDEADVLTGYLGR